MNHGAENENQPAMLRTLCIGHLIALHWLLLTADPMRLIRLQPDLLEPFGELSSAGHLLGFTLLALLALTARWPLPRWAIVLCLIGCALGTEPLQAMVPQRTPELVDCLHNLAGVTIGSAVCWISTHRLHGLDVWRYTW